LRVVLPLRDRAIHVRNRLDLLDPDVLEHAREVFLQPLESDDLLIVSIADEEPVVVQLVAKLLEEGRELGVVVTDEVELAQMVLRHVPAVLDQHGRIRELPAMVAGELRVIGRSGVERIPDGRELEVAALLRARLAEELRDIRMLAENRLTAIVLD